MMCRLLPQDILWNLSFCENVEQLLLTFRFSYLHIFITRPVYANTFVEEISQWSADWFHKTLTWFGCSVFFFLRFHIWTLNFSDNFVSLLVTFRVAYLSSSVYANLFVEECLLIWLYVSFCSVTSYSRSYSIFFLLRNNIIRY